MPLIDRIPTEDWNRVLASAAAAEIDETSLTCLNYEPLATLIPKHWTVIDFGCAYNAQSYWFQEHDRLISVDLPFPESPNITFERFHPSWCELYEMSIKEWIERYFHTIDTQNTFAICGYVPSREVVEVRMKFANLFVYYPSPRKPIL